MNLLSSLSIVFLIYCILDSNAKLAPWTPIDWKTLPKAEPGDRVELSYLVAPLLEESEGNLFKPLKAYHGAIAFQNLNNNMTITINYDAFDIIHAALFPEVVHFPNGTSDLIWSNGGGNFIYMGINETYWNVYNEVIGIINGTTYNEFMNVWNANVNNSNKYYNMFSIMNHFNGKTFYQSWNCFDFCWKAFDIIYGLGVDFDYTKSLVKDDINIYTLIPPINVTDQYKSDPTLRQTIVDLYDLLDFVLKKNEDLSILELLETIFELAEGNFFVREGTEYWQIKLSFPFFGCDAVYSPLPGQKKN